MMPINNELEQWRRLYEQNACDEAFLCLTVKTGNHCVTEERYLEAAPILKRGIELAAGKQDLVALVNCSNNLGITYFMLGELDKGLELHLQALKISESIRDERLIAASCTGIAFIHRNNQAYDEALRYFILAEEASRKSGDPDPQVVSLNEIANVYLYKEDYDRSLEWRLKALELAQRADLPRGVGFVTHDLALTYIYMKEYDKALDLFHYLLDAAKPREDKRETAITHLNIGTVYIHKGLLDQAEAHLLKAWFLTNEVQTRYEMLSVTRQLTIVYEQLENFPEALRWNREALELQQQLYHEEGANALARLQTRHDMERKEREAELYRSHNEELMRANALLEAANENLRKHEAEVVRLERRNSILAMAVTANHEINQPLMVLQGSLELLQVLLREIPDKARVQIDRMADAVQRIRVLLEKYRSAGNVSLGEYSKGTPMAVLDGDAQTDQD
jgi:tetratricopeptide (TPR) repeat protein